MCPYMCRSVLVIVYKAQSHTRGPGGRGARRNMPKASNKPAGGNAGLRGAEARQPALAHLAFSLVAPSACIGGFLFRPFFLRPFLRILASTAFLIFLAGSLVLVSYKRFFL